ncbi:MAG: PEP-CTERM sorting domain-containing protein [Snowella sp.]|nr:PEP-CTERM sorting domain-containing protein [Snowella sp.]
MNNLNFVAKKLTTGVTAAVLVTGAGVLILSQQANAASVTYNSSTNPAVINIPVTSTDWATPPGDTTPYLQIPSFDIANLPAYHQAWAKLTGVTITLSSTFTGTYSATRNNSGLSSPVRVSGGPNSNSGNPIPVGATVSAIGPAGTTFTLDLTPQGQVASYTIAKNGSVTVSNITGSDTQNWSSTSSAALAAFTGSGNLNFQASATAFVNSFKPSGVSDEVNGSADLRAVVTYEYAVPEPITMLGASAAVAFGAAFKRRKNSNKG